MEGAAKDLTALLETARESDGDRLRRKACGSFIPGVSKLNLSDILAVIREPRTVLPAQHEHEGLPEIDVNIYPGRRSEVLGEAQSAVFAAPLAPPEARGRSAIRMGRR